MAESMATASADWSAPWMAVLKAGLLASAKVGLMEKPMAGKKDLL